MRIKDISPDALRRVDDRELLSLHLRTHQLHGAHFADDAPKGRGLRDDKGAEAKDGILVADNDAILDAWKGKRETLPLKAAPKGDGRTFILVSPSLAYGVVRLGDEKDGEWPILFLNPFDVPLPYASGKVDGAVVPDIDLEGDGAPMSLEDLVHAHLFVVEEMLRREIRHKRVSDLDDEELPDGTKAPVVKFACPDPDSMPNVVTKAGDVAAALKPRAGQAVDIFCGMGALSIAAAAEGFHSTLAVENEPLAATSYATNHPRTTVFHGDVRQLNAADLAKALGPVDLVCGGVPCEPFSTIGAKDPTDGRRGLIKVAVKFVKAMRPRYFLFENVPQAMKADGWATARKALQREGYATDFWVVTHNEVGGGTARKRVFFVGVRGGELPSLDDLPRSKSAGFKAALKGITSPPKGENKADPIHVHPGPLQPHAVRNVAQVRAGGKPTATWNVRPTPPQDPAPTLLSQADNLHWSAKRLLTGREMATLHEIPRSYRFVNSTRSGVRKLVGDCVPIRLGRAVLGHLKKAQAERDRERGPVAKGLRAVDLADFKNVVHEAKDVWKVATPRPRAVDLFSGMGGFSLGASAAGFDTVLSVECDERAAATFAENHAGAPVLQADIRKIDPKEIARRVGRIDLVIGGVPCEAFSPLGRGTAPEQRKAGVGPAHMQDKKREKTGRRDLVKVAVKWVEALRPKFVAFENVPEAADSGEWDAAVKSLKRAGYDATIWVMRDEQVGGATKRKRAFLVAKRDGALPSLDDIPRRKATACGSILSKFASPPQGSNHADPLHVHPGPLTDIARRNIAASDRGEAPKAGWAIRPFSADGPAPTITSGNDVIHPNRKRYLTGREIAALHGVPKSYRFPASTTRTGVRDLVGDSVPVPLGRAVLSHLSSGRATKSVVGPMPANLVEDIGDVKRVETSRPRVVDLFSGMGGYSLGARAAGFETVLAVEHEKHAAATFAANHGGTPVFFGDIQKVDPKEARKRVGPVEMMIGGVPCEPYSSSGRGSAPEQRNDGGRVFGRRGLVKVAVSWVEAFSPKFVAFENVPLAADSPEWKAALKSLAGMGYSATIWVVRDDQVGGATTRKRAFLVASKGKLPDLDAIPRRKARTVKDVLAALPSVGSGDPLHVAHGTVSERRLKGIRAQLDGKKIPGFFHEGVNKMDEPAHPIIASRQSIHPSLKRHFTPREVLTMHGVPKSYRFPVNIGTVPSLVGDSVPVALGSAIINHLTGRARKDEEADWLGDATDAILPEILADEIVGVDLEGFEDIAKEHAGPGGFSVKIDPTDLPNVITKQEQLRKDAGGGKRVVDLFSGLGAYSLGAHAAGYRTALAVELEPTAAATFATNNPRSQVYFGDVRKLDPRAVRDKIGKVDLVIGGVPCEPFSSAGNSRVDQQNDPRRGLVGIAAKFVEALEPDFFAFENVPQAAKSSEWGRALKRLKRGGYEVAIWKVSHDEVGGATKRKRAFMVGGKNGLPSLDDLGRKSATPCGEALKGLGNPPSRENPSDPLHAVPYPLRPNAIRNIAYMKANPKATAPPSMWAVRPVDSRQPFFTIVGMVDMLHPSSRRYLTAREAATLHDIPKSYRFPDTRHIAVRTLIGDSVPVALGTAVLKHLTSAKVAKGEGVDRDEVIRCIEEAGEFVVVRDFVSLVGSVVTAPEGRPAKDVDLVVRDDVPDSSVELKLRRLFPPAIRSKVHMVWDAKGPNWAYLPFYDLVLRKRDELKAQGVDEPDYKPYASGSVEKAEAVRLMRPFVPLKARTGYHQGEFFAVDPLLDLWAAPAFKQGKSVAVEPKFDGVRLTVHKDGDRVAIFTEDKKRDRAAILPDVVEDVRKLKDEKLILDGEMVWWKDGKPIARHDMMRIVVGKDPLKGEDLRLNAFDILWRNDDGPLDHMPWAARQAQLEAALPDDTRHLKRARPTVAGNRREFLAAVKRARAYPGSEGAMLKLTDAPYDLDGRSGAWAKLKDVFELQVVVIGAKKKIPSKDEDADFRKQPGRWSYDGIKDPSAWTYRVAFLGPRGKLIPIEADETYTESDLKLRWVDKGEKDPVTGQVASESQWRGTDDPRLWKMGRGFDARKAGDVQYGTTYNTGIEAKIGDVITVTPVLMREFSGPQGRRRYSWTFPIVREATPTRERPDTLEDVRRIVAASSERTPEDMPDEKDVKEVAKSRGRLGISRLQKQRRGQIDPDESTRDQEREAAERAGGDPYMVPQKGKAEQRFVAQLHYRGFWSEDERDLVREALKKARAEAKAGDRAAAREILDNAWKDLGPAILRVPLDELKAGAQRAEDAGDGDVSAAVRRGLDTRPPKVDDLEGIEGRIVNLGNVHADLRMKSPLGEWLIGWTLDTPKVAIQTLDGKAVPLLRNKITHNEEGDNIVAQRKLVQPVAWLDIVSKDKPVHRTGAGQVGATPGTAGEFHYLASGRAVFGVQKTDYHEVFLFPEDGTDWGGRWGLQLIEGRPDYRRARGEFWMANRPKEQSPYITTHDEEKEKDKAKRERIDVEWNTDTVEALRAKGYSPLGPEKAAKRDGRKVRLLVPIAKIAKQERYVLGVVMEPDAVDAHGEVADAADIRRAAHNFLVKGAQIGYQHQEKPGGLTLLESYLAPVEFKLGNRTVPKGTWLMAVRVNNDKVWQEVLDGKLTGFSIEGYAKRVPVAA